MPPNHAFNEKDPSVISAGVAGRILTVTGFSPLIPDLVHRHVAVKQGSEVAHAPVPIDAAAQSWSAEIPVPASFTSGSATAVGTEVYLVTCTDTPAFSAITASQELQLTE